MISRKKSKKFIENFIQCFIQDKQKAFFNFDKLIINRQIYRGKESKDLPYYCNRSVSNWTVNSRPLDVKKFV